MFARQQGRNTQPCVTNPLLRLRVRNSLDTAALVNDHTRRIGSGSIVCASDQAADASRVNLSVLVTTTFWCIVGQLHCTVDFNRAAKLAQSCSRLRRATRSRVPCIARSAPGPHGRSAAGSAAEER